MAPAGAPSEPYTHTHTRTMSSEAPPTTTFEQACEAAKALEWSNDELAQLYGLFKQATVGDVTGERPGILSGLKAGYKWDAWSAQAGVTPGEAQGRYVRMVERKQAALA